MIDSNAWGERVAAAHQSAADAAAVEEQTIRDARDAGVSIADICRSLGTRNRNRVYAILERGADGGEPSRPAAPPVIYLRGAGVRDPLWERLEAAMWARGWNTCHDRTAAWHLARGGTTVVLCDFSVNEPPCEGVAAREEVTVGRVRARYQDTPGVGTVRSLLSTNDNTRLTRAGEQWLDTPVHTVYQDRDLQLRGGGSYPRPDCWEPDAINMAGRPGAYVLDVPALVRLVAQALAT